MHTYLHGQRVQLLPSVQGLVDVIVLAAAEDIVAQQQQVTVTRLFALNNEI